MMVLLERVAAPGERAKPAKKIEPDLMSFPSKLVADFLLQRGWLSSSAVFSRLHAF